MYVSRERRPSILYVSYVYIYHAGAAIATQRQKTEAVMRVNIMLVAQCKITISPERHAEHAGVSSRLLRNLLPPKLEESFNA